MHYCLPDFYVHYQSSSGHLLLICRGIYNGEFARYSGLVFAGTGRIWSYQFRVGHSHLEMETHWDLRPLGQRSAGPDY